MSFLIGMDTSFTRQESTSSRMGRVLATRAGHYVLGWCELELFLKSPSPQADYSSMIIPEDLDFLTKVQVHTTLLCILERKLSRYSVGLGPVFYQPTFALLEGLLQSFSALFEFLMNGNSGI